MSFIHDTIEAGMQTRRYDIMDAMDINNLVGLENFESVVGIAFEEAAEGFDLSPEELAKVFGAVLKLAQTDTRMPISTIEHFKTMLTTGGEVVEGQSDDAAPAGDSPLTGGPKM